jgi:type II secretory pathway pseudopilin PulG
MKNISQQSGFALPLLLASMAIFIIVATSAVLVVDTNNGIVGQNINSQKAFNIAEAGANYYLWHLSHNISDFKDGQTTPITPDAQLGYGPYVHTYYDDNSVAQGTYTLWIKPGSNGSNITSVRSIGKVNGSGTLRTVEAQIGQPSYASYAVASDTALWFGNTESADGPVHSNQGVRMDGSSNSDITSANTTYVPPANLGGNGSTSRAGVWCDTSVTTPVDCSTRSKVDWRYPVPSIDFNQVTGSLCTIKKQAFSADPTTSALVSGASPCTQTPTPRTNNYLPQRSAAGAYAAGQGYLIELNLDGTYNLSQVNAENDLAATYTSALTLVSVATNIPIGTSQVIFAEDNVWVRTNGSYHGRVTIAAGRLATNSNAEVVIADDVLYSSKTGTDVIGLVSEGSFTIAPYAIPQTGNFNFEVDASAIAQSGNAVFSGRYRSDNTKCTIGWSGANQKFLFYGSVATRQMWTWTWLWGGACGNNLSIGGGTYLSGVLNNTTQYDYNLLYSPPPSFPTTGSFNILQWREVLTKP